MSKTTVLNRLILLIAPWLGAMSAWGQELPSRPLYVPVILAVSVNGLAGDQGVLMLQTVQNQLFVPITLLQDWSLQLGGQGMTAANGLRYIDLASLPGVRFSWDQARTELAISAESDAFLTTHVNADEDYTAPVAPYTPGAYLNYDLLLTDSPGSHERLALLDMGLFRGEGLFTGNWVTGTLGTTRLMSRYQIDQVSAMKTLRIGDNSNSTGAWGRAVLFGGLQYGTHFAIRPNFIAMALPSASGRALLPSTVDVYVNNALRTRQNVSAGPFSIQNLPVMTGAGEVQVVVKDLLGREQVLTQSFFASPRLLRPGLVEDAWEIGWQRNHYGHVSNDYSDPFAAMTYRQGVNQNLTGEARLELQKNIATAGLSAAASVPALRSVAEMSVVLSHAERLDPGRLLGLRYSYLGKRWSGNAQWQWQSSSFRQLGSNPDRLEQQSGSVQLALPVGAGTLSVSYLRQQIFGENLTRLIHLNYSHRLARDLLASLTLFKPLWPDTGTTLGLTLTLLLDAQRVASSTLMGGTGAHSAYTQVSRSTPHDQGLGYRVASLNGADNARQEASVSRNQSMGSFQAEVVRQQSDVSTRLGLQGGLAVLDGDVYVGRRLDQSFAVVKLDGAPRVPVYLENQVVAHTNWRGRAVVGPLQAYQDNHISIDPLSFSLDTTANAIKKTVVPRSQGGVMLDFELRQVHRFTLTLVQINGAVLPAWTEVEVSHVTQTFVVGHRGAVFVEFPQRTGNRVSARLPDGSTCSVTVDVPHAASNLSFLEPMTCLPTH